MAPRNTPELPEGLSLLERYTIIDRVGGGGMADIYRAHDSRLDRIVCVKLLRNVIEGSGSTAGASSTRRRTRISSRRRARCRSWPTPTRCASTTSASSTTPTRRAPRARSPRALPDQRVPRRRQPRDLRALARRAAARRGARPSSTASRAPSPRLTARASSTATSSRRTSCSRAWARCSCPSWPTSASRAACACGPVLAPRARRRRCPTGPTPASSSRPFRSSRPGGPRPSSSRAPRRARTPTSTRSASSSPSCSRGRGSSRCAEIDVDVQRPRRGRRVRPLAPRAASRSRRRSRARSWTRSGPILRARTQSPFDLYEGLSRAFGTPRASLPCRRRVTPAACRPCRPALTSQDTASVEVNVQAAGGTRLDRARPSNGSRSAAARCAWCTTHEKLDLTFEPEPGTPMGQTCACASRCSRRKGSQFSVNLRGLSCFIGRPGGPLQPGARRRRRRGRRPRLPSQAAARRAGLVLRQRPQHPRWVGPGLSRQPRGGRGTLPLR